MRQVIKGSENFSPSRWTPGYKDRDMAAEQSPILCHLPSKKTEHLGGPEPFGRSKIKGIHLQKNAGTMHMIQAFLNMAFSHFDIFILLWYKTIKLWFGPNSGYFPSLADITQTQIKGRNMSCLGPCSPKTYKIINKFLFFIWRGKSQFLYVNLGKASYFPVNTIRGKVQ